MIEVTEIQAFRPATLLKRDSQVLTCEICRIFQNTYFDEHLRATAFDLYGKPIVFFPLNNSQDVAWDSGFSAGGVIYIYIYIYIYIGKRANE